MSHHASARLALSIPVLAAALALPAGADVPTLTATPSGGSLEPGPYDCDGFIEWEQFPDGQSGLSSQDDVCYPFVSEMADDFVAGYGDVGIGWWGVYWNGSPVPPDGFRISYYLDDAGVPGEEVATRYLTEYNEAPGDPYGYCGTFSYVFLEYGCTYHVSVIADACFPPQWGVATGTGNGAEAHFRSDFFGFADWTPATDVFGIGYELALLRYVEVSSDRPTGGTWCCRSDGTCVWVSGCEECDGIAVPTCDACAGTPVNRSTWGRMKALYR